MVGRDQREGSDFLCEGGKKKKVKYILAKGLQLFSEKKKEGKKPKPNQPQTKTPALLFKIIGLWSQAGSAWKSRPTAHPSARPGRDRAAPGVIAFVLTDKRANSGQKPLSSPPEMSVSVGRQSF